MGLVAARQSLFCRSQADRWTEIHIYAIREGKIREHWVELSMLELLKHMGAA
jgi:predicted ester cyclase